MPSRSRTRSRQQRRSRARGRTLAGGAADETGPISASAADWMINRSVGTGAQQMDNALKIVPGQIEPQSLAIRSLSGQVAGGRRSRRKSRTQRRGRRGGFFGEVITQAAVPFTLLGMQQSYGRRNSKKPQFSEKRGRRGGFYGEEALVPLTLIAANQTFGTRKSKKDKFSRRA